MPVPVPTMEGGGPFLSESPCGVRVDLEWTSFVGLDPEDKVMYSRRLGYVSCSLTFLVLSVNSGRSQGEPLKPPPLRVLVPPGQVRVLVDGKTTAAKTGKVREISAPLAV